MPTFFFFFLFFFSRSYLLNSPPLLYSLQYQNRKAEYFKAIWDVINWKAVEKRFA